MSTIVQTAVAAPSAKRAPNRAWRKLKANKGALVGLAIILPILGHATWHLYRKVVG